MGGLEYKMKIYIKTFGCRVNQVESEALLENCLQKGFTSADDIKQADLCLLNTCAVTHRAERDAKKEIRTILRQNPRAKIIITGCCAKVRKEALEKEFPSLKIILKDDVASFLFGREIDWSVKAHSGKTRAFVKIQDGCNNFCSYCIVPFARPIKTSKPKEIVLEEIQNLIKNGYREIVLSGINIGNYLCPKSGANLAVLLSEICALEGNFRIRFSSIELNTITDDLLEAAQTAGKKFCPYLHIPLQSGSSKVLKEMNRKYDAPQYIKRLKEIKDSIKEIAFFTDVIAGFPTETEQDFKQTLALIEQVKFAGLHVFSYSKREGTSAALMKQLPSSVIKERSIILHSLDKKLRQDFALSLKGQKQDFLAEEYVPSKKVLSGVLANFARAEIACLEQQKTPCGVFEVEITDAKDGVCLAKRTAGRVC